jgi:diacylglycerol kinase family enzyme
MGGSTLTHRRSSHAAVEHLKVRSATDRRRMLLVVNPYATTVSERLRRLVVNGLSGRYEVDAVDTQARGHATELCREAAQEGYDVVVAFGGDGTVNEAANGLLGSPTPLCCLPGGSANVFAKMLGIPGEIVDATAHLLSLADDWYTRKVDLGVVNGRCFTFASGLGLDASVVERVDANPRMKARFGPYFFASVAARTFLRRYLLSPPQLALDAGGETHTGVTAIVQNGTPFTYFKDRPIELAEDVALDSGALAASVLHRTTPFGLPRIGWRALSPNGRIGADRHVTGISELTELTVRTADERPLPLQVDGDFLGNVAVARYSILKEALTIVS